MDPYTKSESSSDSSQRAFPSLWVQFCHTSHKCSRFGYSVYCNTPRELSMPLYPSGSHFTRLLHIFYECQKNPVASKHLDTKRSIIEISRTRGTELGIFISPRADIVKPHPFCAKKLSHAQIITIIDPIPHIPMDI